MANFCCAGGTSHCTRLQINIYTSFIYKLLADYLFADLIYVSSFLYNKIHLFIDM